ncbi:MAG: PAS domain S-box protein [Bacteroidota bacterium]
MKNKADDDNADLYRRAVALMNKKPAYIAFPPSESDALSLFHELEVHKAELECQNEELVAAIEAAQDAISLYDLSPTGFLTLSEDGLVLNLNLCGAEMLGKSRRELIHANFILFLTPDTIAAFRLFMEKMFNSKSREFCEVTLMVKGRAPVYLHLTGIISRTGNQCLVTMADITGRKKAEDGLSQSQVLLKSSIESQKDTILLSIDNNYRYLYFNKAHADTMKHAYGTTVALGMDILECIASGEDRLRAKENYDRALSGESHTNIRIYGEVERNYYESFFNPIRDENNKIVGATALARDITGRIMVEKKLWESEQRLSSIYNSVEDAVYDMVVEPGPAYRFLYVNQSFCRVTGLTHDQVEGRLVGEVIPEPSLSMVIEKFRQAIEERRIIRWEEVSDYPSGQLIGEASITPVYHDTGLCTHLVGTVHDITERKKSEREIRIKNEELEKRNAEKDKFFSILAHDLRSPFNAFLGLTQIMADDLPDMTPEKSLKIALTLRKSAGNVYRLLENLLEWSRMERGITPFTPVTFLLMPKVTECIAVMQESAQNKGIAINILFPEGMLVYADEYMFCGLIRNLVGNAVKFTAKGGRVDIAANPVDGGAVEISVTDTGIGMSPKMVANLFKLEADTRRKGTDNEPSTGLGLMICRDFIEKHGGRLRVESEEGVGSTFRFSLPGAQ